MSKVKYHKLLSLIKSYNEYTKYIDDYRQEQLDEKRNKIIEAEFSELLKELGIEPTGNEIRFIKECTGNGRYNYKTLEESLNAYLKNENVILERETDLDSIRSTTKAIARAIKPKEAIKGTGIAIHPFVNSITWLKGNDLTKIQMLNDDDAYEEWTTEFDEIVDNSDLVKIYMLWRDAWKLTFMKFCGEYLSDKDYAEYLADAWVTEENPNMDANVSISEAIKMFKKADKQHLMVEKDLEYYNNLPDEIEVWRGVSKGRVKKGLSWTNNKAKAEWFMNRWKSDDNVLLYLKVKKEDVLAYFNTREEKELVIDINKYRSKITVVE